MPLLKLPPTLTPFSKYLALLLFILLPFIGFILGIQYSNSIAYHKNISSTQIPSSSQPSNSEHTPPNNNNNFTTWKTYTDPQNQFTFKYPADWIVSGGEGGFQTLGPAARLDQTPPLIENYPYISIGKSIGTIAEYRSERTGSLIQVDGHQAFKSDINRNPDLSNLYTIIIDNSTLENPQQVITIYTTFNQSEYELYGADTDFDVQQFINTIDNILSTFRFLDQQLCTTDTNCTPDQFCDVNQPCSMGPNGLVCGDTTGTQQCVQLCDINSECPSNKTCVPYELIHGDIISTHKGCQ